MDKRKLLTQNDYSKIYKLYSADFEKDYEHFEIIDEVIGLLSKNKLSDKPMVDLGSGPGTVSDYLYNKGIKNITAVDFTEEFCEFLKEKYKNKSIKVVKSDITEFVVNQITNSIASYFANFSLIHIPDEEIDPIFKSISRSLLPGGMFVMVCFKGKFKGLEKEPYQAQNDKRLSINKELSLYMNYFTETELVRRVKSAGLEVLKINSFAHNSSDVGFTNDKIWLVCQKPL